MFGDAVEPVTGWAKVTQLSPSVQVRFPGGDDVDVTLVNADLTLALNDKVAMLRVGSQWVVAFVLGDA